MYKLRNITKSYNNKVVLDNVSLELPNNGLVLLQGENGSGKSTLLNVISNRIKYKGTHNIDSKDIFYVFNLEPLYDNLSLENKAKLLIDLNRYDEFLELLKLYNLYDLLSHKVKTLSNGERQKTDLLIANCSSAKIILLDEPLEYIDVNSKDDFAKLIYDMGENSLVIETVHNYLHDCDYHYIVNDHKVELVKQSDKPEVKTTNVLVSRLSLMKAMLLSYNFKKRLSLYLSLLILSVLMFLTTFSVRFNNTTVDDIKENVLKNSTNDLIYELNNNTDITEDIAFLNPLLSFDYYIKSDGFMSISLVVKDEIYYKGNKVKLSDNDIYISDYIYNCAKFNFNVYNKDVYFPKRIEHEYDVSSIKYHFLDDIYYKYNTHVYDTDFEEYEITSVHGTNEQIEEAELLRERVNNFYNIAYINSTMALNILNPFVNKNIKDKLTSDGLEHSIIVKYNDSLYEFCLYNRDGNTLGDDSFNCNIFTSDKIFNKPNHELTENDTITIGDKVLKYQGNLNGVIPREVYRIYLSYNMMSYLSDYLITKKFKDYNISFVKSLKNEVKENPSLFTDLDLKLSLNTYNEQYLYQKNNYDTFKETNSTILTVSLILILVLSLGYIAFIFRPRYKTDKLLLYKGYSKSRFLLTNYTIDIFTIIIFVIIAVGVSLFVFPKLMAILKILF